MCSSFVFGGFPDGHGPLWWGPVHWSGRIWYSTRQPDHRQPVWIHAFLMLFLLTVWLFHPLVCLQDPGQVLWKGPYEKALPHSQHQQMTPSTLSRKLVLNSSGGWGLLSSGHASAFTCSLNSQARREPVWFVSTSENPAQGLVLSGHVGNEWRNGYTHNESMAHWVRCCHC